MIKSRYCIALLLLFAFSPLAAQQSPPDSQATEAAPERDNTTRRYVLDDVAAVVGGEIILASDIKMTVLQTARDQNISVQDTSALNRVIQQVLEEAVAEKVLLHQAKEAKVEVSEDELNQQVESQMNDLRARYSSDEELQRSLSEAGQTLVGLKDSYRESARERLMGQTFLRDHSHEMARVKVTEEEARQFFDQQQSRSMRPEEVKIMHLVIAPKPGQEILDRAKAKIDSVYKMYQDGADFAYLAEKYSDDPSASKGGDLGYFSKGEMVKEFEEAAFDMKVGEVRMVRTKFGWHLLRVEARRQKEARVRHILARTEVREDDWARARQETEALRQKVLEGADFFKLAKENSEEASQLPENPPMLELDKLKPQMRAALNGTMTPVPGTKYKLSDVLETRPEGYLLVLEMDHKDAAPWSFDEVKSQIISSLEQQKMIEAYVDKLREKTYIDVRFKGWTPGGGQ